jgi:hypothetical protein
LTASSRRKSGAGPFPKSRYDGSSQTKARHINAKDRWNSLQEGLAHPFYPYRSLAYFIQRVSRDQPPDDTRLSLRITCDSSLQLITFLKRPPGHSQGAIGAVSIVRHRPSNRSDTTHGISRTNIRLHICRFFPSSIDPVRAMNTLISGYVSRFNRAADLSIRSSFGV